MYYALDHMLCITHHKSKHHISVNKKDLEEKTFGLYERNSHFHNELTVHMVQLKQAINVED